MRNARLSRETQSTPSGGENCAGTTANQPRRGFCVFIDTICEGSVPSVFNDKSTPFVFDTRIAAEREIADLMMARLQEFIDGERDFDDAVITEEYVIEVDVQPDGSIVTEDDTTFG
jgi:hypothetical protein